MQTSINYEKPWPTWICSCNWFASHCKLFYWINNYCKTDVHTFEQRVHMQCWLSWYSLQCIDAVLSYLQCFMQLCDTAEFDMTERLWSSVSYSIVEFSGICHTFCVKATSSKSSTNLWAKYEILEECMIDIQYSYVLLLQLTTWSILN